MNWLPSPLKDHNMLEEDHLEPSKMVDKEAIVACIVHWRLHFVQGQEEFGQDRRCRRCHRRRRRINKG